MSIKTSGIKQVHTITGAKWKRSMSKLKIYWNENQNQIELRQDIPLPHFLCINMSKLDNGNLALRKGLEVKYCTMKRICRL